MRAPAAAGAAAPAAVEPPRLHLEAAVGAHIGLVREKQEDAHLWRPALGLAAVADGMGGHLAGDVASRLAVEALAAHFDAVAAGTPARGLAGLLRRLGVGVHPQDELAAAIRRANRRILTAARRSAEHRGMGTTVVVGWLRGDRLHFAHVGDSRLYHLRRGILTRLTEDHSLLNEQLRRGLLSPEDAAAFPHRNVILRAVGLAGGLEVDTGDVVLEPDDRLLLCSDGLTDLVDDEKIGAALGVADRPAAAAQALVSLALAAGGVDNVTALAIHVHPNPSPAVPGDAEDDPSPALAACAVPGDSTERGGR